MRLGQASEQLCSPPRVYTGPYVTCPALSVLTLSTSAVGKGSSWRQGGSSRVRPGARGSGFESCSGCRSFRHSFHRDGRKTWVRWGQVRKAWREPCSRARVCVGVCTDVEARGMSAPTCGCARDGGGETAQKAVAAGTRWRGEERAGTSSSLCTLPAFPPCLRVTSCKTTFKTAAAGRKQVRAVLQDPSRDRNKAHSSTYRAALRLNDDGCADGTDTVSATPGESRDMDVRTDVRP